MNIPAKTVLGRRASKPGEIVCTEYSHHFKYKELSIRVGLRQRNVNKNSFIHSFPCFPQMPMLPNPGLLTRGGRGTSSKSNLSPKPTSPLPLRR